MGIKEYIKANEKTYHSIKDIKYLFFEGKDSNKLIVTFPAMQSEGLRPSYNYIDTLSDIKDFKLFLLDDFGSRGSYLISKNRDHSIETSVISLILKICKENGIKTENVILQGSSKGAFSALYFGIKYRFGHVIAGAPQTKLGNFLLMNAPKVADYMVGGHDADDIYYLNNLLFDLLKYPSNNFPKIFIHIGRGDDHYEHHVVPFIEALDKINAHYQLDIHDYFYHSSVAIYYQNYLIKVLKQINKEKIKPLIDEVNIEYKNHSLEIICNAEGQTLEYDCYIFKQGDLIEKLDSQKENSFTYPVNFNSIYCAKLCVKDSKNNINCELTSEIKVDGEKSQPVIHDVSIEYKKRSLRITCKAEGQTLEYACYILCEGQIIKKIMYQKDNVFQYPIKSEGTYRAILFAKNHENSINTKKTRIIQVYLVPQRKHFVMKIPFLDQLIHNLRKIR